MKRVVLCTGQVYYDLIEKRNETAVNDVAIIRIEELAPFPYEMIKQALSAYQNAQFSWVQEEHENQGAWTFVKPRIKAVLKELFTENKIK